MKKIFFRYFSTYLLILVLPIILGWTIYDRVLTEFESYIKQTNLALLKQTREIIDRFTTDVQWRVFQIANNLKLKRLIYEDLDAGVLKEFQILINSTPLAPIRKLKKLRPFPMRRWDRPICSTISSTTLPGLPSSNGA